MTERLNIRRMQIPEQEGETGPSDTFDPKRDITRDDWSHMKGRLEDERGESLTAFLSMIAHMRAMAPELVREPTEDEANFVPGLLKHYEEGEDGNHFVWVAAAARILDIPRKYPIG